MQPQDTSPPQIAPSPQAVVSKNPAHFQRYLPWLLILGAIWVAIGRGLFGVGGWGAIFTLLLLGPFLIAYTVVVSIILHTKSKRGYVMGRWTKWAFIALLACMSAFGFFMVDGGDTRESVRSVFTSLFGVSQASSGNSGPSPLLLQVSQAITTVSYYVGALLLIATTALLVVDKGIGEIAENRTEFGGTTGPMLAGTGQSRKWRRLLIALNILLAVSIAALFFINLWGYRQTGGGGFFASVVASGLGQIAGLVSFAILALSLVYIIRYKPQGKLLFLCLLSLLASSLSAYYFVDGNYSIFRPKFEQAQISEQDQEKIDQEYEQRDRLFQEQEEMRIRKMSSEITKEEAISMLESCQIKSLYYTEQTSKIEPGRWGELSSTGVIITEYPKSFMTMSIADRYISELIPIAREKARTDNCRIQLINNELTESI